MRIAREERRIDPQQRHDLVAAARDPGFVPAHQPRDRLDVGGHGPMRKQSDALDDVADALAQTLRRFCGDIAAAQPDRAGVWRDQAIDRAQQGRFSTAGRADQHEKGALVDRERAIGERRGAREGLGDVVDLDHQGVSTAARRRRNPKSVASASRITGMAPTNTRSSAYSPMPWKMKVPSPPPPISAATVASPIA